MIARRATDNACGPAVVRSSGPDDSPCAMSAMAMSSAMDRQIEAPADRRRCQTRRADSWDWIAPWVIAAGPPPAPSRGRRPRAARTGAHHLVADSSQCRRVPARRLVLVHEQRADALDELAVAIEADHQTILDLARLRATAVCAHRGRRLRPNSALSAPGSPDRQKLSAEPDQPIWRPPRRCPRRSAPRKIPSSVPAPCRPAS